MSDLLFFEDSLQSSAPTNVLILGDATLEKRCSHPGASLSTILLSKLFSMTSQLDIASEIRRRRKEVNKRSLYFLVPFGLTTLGAWIHAPRILLIVTFCSFFVGLAVWTFWFFKLSRCPSCNASLRDLFMLTPVYKRCPYCHILFE